MSSAKIDVDNVYKILSQREAVRLEHSRPSNSRYPSPEQVYYSAAKSLKCRKSNRYSNILAYDRTAVTVGHDGYLNANVVRGSNGHWWVASQAPIATTLHEFFHAILHRSASAHPLLQRATSATRPGGVIIVQLTGWEENGVSKADPYLTKTETYSTNRHLQPISVELKSQCKRESLCSTITEARVASNDEKIELYHYHFTAWPDHGVPTGQGVTALRKLIDTVAEQRECLGGLDQCEVWVHCSAGVGRTGAFIALSSLLLPAPKLGSSIAMQSHNESPLGDLPAPLDKDPVACTIDGIREWRGYLVQNRQQMGLVYDIAGAQKD